MSRTGRPRSNSKRTALLDALRSCGTSGGISTDLGPACGARDTTVSQWLKVMADEGIVGWWPDPVGKCINRRRWWLAEFKPAKKPAPSGIKAGLRSLDEQDVSPHWRSRRAVPIQRKDGVTVVPGYTHDPRYQVAPGERVVGGFASMGVGRYLESEGRA